MSNDMYTISNCLCKAIITGPEHSGTTILSKLINSHSKIKSGFECGIFLGNLNNFNVKPFSDWLMSDEWFFGLPKNYQIEIRNMNYKQVLEYLGKNKGSYFKESYEQSLIKNAEYYVDKTPRYIYNFKDIYEKIPFKIPIFIIFKCSKELYYSKMIKRHNVSKKSFIHHIIRFIKSLKYINSLNSDNIYVIQYTDFVNKIDKYSDYIMKKINIDNEILSLDTFNKIDKNSKMLYSNYNKKKKDKKIFTNNDLMFIKQYSHILNIYDGLINKLKIKI